MGDVLLVTGMHRSGTSLVASWCEQMGLRMHLDRMIGPHAGNPKGHFEDVEFVNLHAEAIRGLGQGTRGWKTTAPRFLQFSEAQRVRACELIAARSGERLWGWKDPRSVLFLDEWRRMIPDLHVLFLWRPAQSVVASLLRRSALRANADMTVGWLQAARVWKAYNTLILDYKAHHPERSLLLPIADLLAADRLVYELLRDHLRLELSYRPVEELYDHALMHDRLVDRHDILARAATATLGCAKIEERLRSLSDLAQPV